MAYTYKIENNYKPVPQTAFVGGRGPTYGIACHWTVGNPGRAGALGTINYFLANPGLNASYHELWWWENKTFGVMRIVPVANAAHSMNPASANPDAIARAAMASGIVDANRYAYAVSFCGSEAHLNPALQDPDFVRAAARRVRELMDQFKSTMTARPLFAHRNYQPPPNKIDWGTVFTGKIYEALATPEGDEMRIWRPKTQRWTTIVGAPFFIGNEKKFFTSAVEVESFLESGEYVDGNWTTPSTTSFRLVRWPPIQGNDEVLEVPRLSLVAKGTGLPGLPGSGPDLSGKVAELEGRISRKNAKADELKAI